MKEREGVSRLGVSNMVRCKMSWMVKMVEQQEGSKRNLVVESRRKVLGVKLVDGQVE